MTLTDRIIRNLTRNGPATASDVAEAVHERLGPVAATLSSLMAENRVREWGNVQQNKRGAQSTIYEAVA